MKKFAFLLSIVLISSFILGTFTSCGTQKTKLNVYNWGEYIADGSNDSMDVIAKFEEENSDIDVVYTTFSSAEEMYAKLQSGSAKYDVIIAGNYMVSRMIQEDMLQKVDLQKISNYSNLDESFTGLEYDPTNEYSVAYAWGTVGIIYNTTMVDEEVDSWDILWNEKYKNNILMFNNPRDAFAIALKKLGYSQNTTDKSQIDEAAQLLKEQKPLVQAYVMSEILDKMIIGEAALGVYYSGDAVNMIAENEDLDFVIPQEGSNLFSDAMVIPKTSTKVDEAHRFIDFMLREDVALENISFISFSTPMTSVKALLDDEIRNSEIIYPSDETLAKCEVFVDLPADINEYMQELWIDVLSSNS